MVSHWGSKQFYFMNGKNRNSKEIDHSYFVPDNFLFPNIFSSIFIKKGQIQQKFALPYILREIQSNTSLYNNLNDC